MRERRWQGFFSTLLKTIVPARHRVGQHIPETISWIAERVSAIIAPLAPIIHESS
jgi:hypothetical protein